MKLHRKYANTILNENDKSASLTILYIRCVTIRWASKLNLLKKWVWSVNILFISSSFGAFENPDADLSYGRNTKTFESHRSMFILDLHVLFWCAYKHMHGTNTKPQNLLWTRRKQKNQRSQQPAANGIPAQGKKCTQLISSPHKIIIACLRQCCSSFHLTSFSATLYTLFIPFQGIFIENPCPYIEKIWSNAWCVSTSKYLNKFQHKLPSNNKTMREAKS